MKKKILVVDDNRMILKFLSNLLDGEGHEVKTCEDGLSALSLLTTYEPDIVFVDLIIPKIGGDKLCQIIRTMDHMNNCYLVIISAAVAEMDLDFRKIGVNACIAKGPFGQMGKHVLAAIEDSSNPSNLDIRARNSRHCFGGWHSGICPAHDQGTAGAQPAPGNDFGEHERGYRGSVYQPCGLRQLRGRQAFWRSLGKPAFSQAP
jgi:CheY-like chemotaxis protein